MRLAGQAPHQAAGSFIPPTVCFTDEPVRSMLAGGHPSMSEGGVILKKRLIVLLALAVVIAAAVVSTASAALVDNGGLCTVRHSGGSFIASCGG